MMCCSLAPLKSHRLSPLHQNILSPASYRAWRLGSNLWLRTIRRLTADLLASADFTVMARPPGHFVSNDVSGYIRMQSRAGRPALIVGLLAFVHLAQDADLYSIFS